MRAREILFEAQDVADLGAAPAVDRLVVVADTAQIAALLSQQPQPQILGDVGVLVLVDEQIAEAPLVIGEESGLPVKSVKLCSIRSPKSTAFTVISRSWYWR